MDLTFLPVNIKNDLDTCIRFRKDAWVVSFGSEQGFSEEEAVQWFHSLSEKNPDGFLHVWHDQEIIGQLEFRSNIVTSDGQKAGYANLFYLAPDYRGKGLGQVIHDYVIERFKNDQCVGAMLRYIPGNDRAENFYTLNGWYLSGKPELKRGQLMRKDFVGS